uniref:Uncharacterized protein n=1 Tax=Romanomermis culicivorax TaxID=13658 RepID=A0A915JML4_ROMCU
LPVHLKTHSAAVQLEKTPSLADDQRRQIETVRQFGAMNRYRRKAHDTTTTAQQALRCLDRVRCAAHECPVLVRKDFMNTFPDSNINNEQNLTVITITEKPTTSSAMPTKSDNDFIDNIYVSQSVFSNVAEEICNFVRASGFWADFVDPFSGKLFSGDFASPTDLAGTELALNRFSGLSVESAGSCKVISRQRLSINVNDGKITEPVENELSPSVVGLIFTAASVDSPVIQFLLKYAAELVRDDVKNDVQQINFDETANRKIDGGVFETKTM